MLRLEIPLGIDDLRRFGRRPVIFINFLTDSSEEVVDRVERTLCAAGVKMPVLLKPCGIDGEKVTIAGWRVDQGPICHVVEKGLFCDPHRSAELDHALAAFLRLLQA